MPTPRINRAGTSPNFLIRKVITNCPQHTNRKSYAKGLCKSCWREYRKVYRKKYYENNKIHYRILSQRYQQDIKKRWADAYGGKCECCEESRVEFLTIEHRNGDGKKHRKAVGFGNCMGRWLEKKGWPRDKFGILCLNCNFVLGHSGYCPHRPPASRDYHSQALIFSPPTKTVSCLPSRMAL